MKYSTILTTSLYAITTALAKPIQPEYTHSIPEVLNEGEPIPNWQLQGSAKVYSDRLTLTDLGKQKQWGSAWSTVANDYDKWTVDVDLSVAGPINPGGGLALWYTTKIGAFGPVYGSNDKWDGLGIFIDSIGSDPESDTGSLRAYLNDESLEYARLGNPVEKAFSNCAIKYRNTGYKNTLKVSYQPGFFRIKINDAVCFQTDKITLPKSGYFGVTASNTENADSFIIGRVQVYADIVPPIGEESQPQDQAHANALLQQQQQVIQPRSVNGEDKTLSTILQRLDTLSGAGGSQGGDSAAISEIRAELKALQEAHEKSQANIEKTITGLERTVKNLIELQRQALEHGSAVSSSDHNQKAKLDQEMKKLQTRVEEINNAVKQHTESLIQSIPGTISNAISTEGPSLWFIFFLFLGVQILVLFGSVVYKARKGKYHDKIL
jgi:mannose-binding lectin 1